MSLKEVLGFGSDKKIRYAVVGAGDIAQEDMMPGIAHTGNSVLTALVTGDPKKAAELGEMYDVKATYTYEEFPQALTSGTFDAIYLATPNWRHAEFVVPALQAGIHGWWRSRWRCRRRSARRSLPPPEAPRRS